VAHQTGSDRLLESVHSTFVPGMDITLWVCGGIGLVGLLLTLVVLPGRPRPVELPAPVDAEVTASR
jgi:hypothetical protein